MFSMILLDAGLRPEEASALRWGRVDLEARVLRVEEAFARGKHLGPPKSGRPRAVELSRRLVGLLGARRDALGRELAPDEFIFPARTARRRALGLPGFDANNYRRRHFAEVCRRAKLLPRRPYDLRHSFASQLIMCGVQILHVSAQLGHANTQITLDAYTRWADDKYRRPIPLHRGEVAADLLTRLRDGERRSRLRVVREG